MSKRRKRNLSPEERQRSKQMREQIQSWRRHPDDPWAELERLGLTEVIAQLGWTQPRVTRAMNSVGSEERFKLKLHRAVAAEADRPLYMAKSGQPGTPVETHGYTRNAGSALEPEAEVIDLPTLDRLTKEGAQKRLQRVAEIITACEEVRAALDERVQHNPDFMRLAGRHVWVVRSKIDGMLRDLRRKAA